MTLLKVLALCLMAGAVSVAFAVCVTLLFRGPAWLFSLGRKHAREIRAHRGGAASGPVGSPSPPRRAATRWWPAPLVILLLLTPFMINAGIASAGAGHGDYVTARMLFPYTMLSVAWAHAITPFYIFVGVAQWPVYGLALSLSLRRGWWLFVICLSVLLAVHVAAAHSAFRYVPW
jgi:hypothetical protein